MTKANELAHVLIDLLDASPLDPELKRQALMQARAHLQHAPAQAQADERKVEEWRKERAARGPVGTGKKTDAIKANIPTKAGRGKK